MLLRGGTSPTRLIPYLLLTLTYIGTVHGSLYLFHEINISKEHEDLFKEALHAIDIDPSSVRLEALQSKKGPLRSSFIAYYVSKARMLCRLKYDVALYAGLHVSSFTCNKLRKGEEFEVPGKTSTGHISENGHHHLPNPSEAPKKLIANRAYRGKSYRLED